MNAPSAVRAPPRAATSAVRVTAPTTLSLEILAPAIAPIIGAALLVAFGWQSSFYLVAALALLLCIAWLAVPGLRSLLGRIERVEAGYFALLGQAGFLRYAISQACTLGGLLVIVFSAPKVITSGLGGGISDFIVMQVSGIVFFVVAANMTQVFTGWWGAEGAILVGSVMSAAGCAAILVTAILGIQSIWLLWAFFIPVNFGLGIRGPVGFYKSLEASGANESRGSALVVFSVMLVAALGTVVVAPFIELGLLPVAIVSTVISVGSVLLLVFVSHDRPPLVE
jgi:predicted MFS family arabinose efflux permease